MRPCVLSSQPSGRALSLRPGKCLFLRWGCRDGETHALPQLGPSRVPPQVGQDGDTLSFPRGSQEGTRKVPYHPSSGFSEEHKVGELTSPLGSNVFVRVRVVYTRRCVPE